MFMESFAFLKAFLIDGFDTNGLNTFEIASTYLYLSRQYPKLAEKSVI